MHDNTAMSVSAPIEISASASIELSASAPIELSARAPAQLTNEHLNLGQELLAELLNSGHQVVVTARGSSMSPSIADGERLLIVPLAHAQPRRGDIVYIQRADASYVLHRVLRVFADGRLQTCGDAHWRLDDAVLPCAVLGRVRSTHRGSRAGLDALATWVRCWLRLALSWVQYRRAVVREMRATRWTKRAQH